MKPRFRLFGSNPALWPCLSQGTASATASMLSTCTHHLLTSLHIAVLHSTPETKQRTLSFSILAQTETPGMRPNGQPHPHLHLTYITPATLQPLPHHRFEWHAPKPSHNSSVSGFWPKSETPQCVIEQVAAPAPAPHLPH